MKTSRILILITILFFIVSFNLPAQEKQNENIPENVKQEFQKLNQNVENNIYNIQYMESYNWSFQTNLFANILFKAELTNDVVSIKQRLKKDYDNKYGTQKPEQETEESTTEQEQTTQPEVPTFTEFLPDNYHALFIRIYQKDDFVRSYKAPIPYDAKPLNYFSYGLILDPGEYTIHMVLADVVYKEKTGSKIIKINVPDLTIRNMIQKRRKLETSEPVFYRMVQKLTSVNNKFTVLKNKYEVGPAKLRFYPYYKDNSFKTKTKPILTFYILGALPTMSGGKPQWSIEAKITIKGNEKKVEFEKKSLKNPFFYQPIILMDGDKPLPAGEYILEIKLKDNNTGTNGDLEIPFTIVE